MVVDSGTLGQPGIRHINKLDGRCTACEHGEHIACDGAGFCTCDLCVPYDLRLADQSTPPDGRLMAIAILVAFAIFFGLLLFGGFVHA
jgi:hypothetical protein